MEVARWLLVPRVGYCVRATLGTFWGALMESREVCRHRLLGGLLVLLFWVGCDRSATPPDSAASGSSGTSAPEPSESDKETPEVPDSLDACIERGKARFRTASSKPWDERVELCQAAWQDFQKAHEFAGGVWNFDFKPWEPPDGGRMPTASPERPTESEPKGSARALTAAARMCLRLFRSDQAAILMDRARAIDSDDPHVQLVCLQLEGLATGDWTRVNADLKRLIESPALRENATAWFVCGFGLMSAGDHSAAERAYRRCLELDPSEEGARVNLGSVLAAQNRMDEAAALQSEMQEGSAGQVYSDLNIGFRFITKRRYEEAIPILEGVTGRAPGLPAGWMNLAGCYAQTGRFEAAVQAYRMLTTLMPQEASGFALLGHTYTQMGKYDEAINTLKHAEQLPSATYSVQLGLAEAHQGAGRLEEAEQALKRAWQMDSTADAVCNMYGEYLRKHKRLAESVELMSTAIQRFPDQAGPYVWRAAAHLELGDIDQALADRSKLIELAPEATNYINRAFVRKLAGRPIAEIRADLEAALDK